MDELCYKKQEIRQEFFTEEMLVRAQFEDCRFLGIRFDDMLFDHCTWDEDYKQITQRIRRELVQDRCG